MQRFGKVFEWDAPDGWCETAARGRFRYDGPQGQALIVSGRVLEGESTPEELASLRVRLLEVMLEAMRKAADDPELELILPLHREDHALPCHTLGSKTRDGASLFLQAAVEHERGVLLVSYEAALIADEVARFGAIIRSIRPLGAREARVALARAPRRSSEADPEMQELRLLLRSAQQESKQATLRRRPPAPSAIPRLEEAARRLATYAEHYPDRAEGWRLLSMAKESLLHYPAAIQDLERAASIDGSPRNDLKRLAALREAAAFWTGLGLSPWQLGELGEHLERLLPDNGCRHDLTLTREWCDTVGVADVAGVLEALRERGGYCDCQVLSNVVS